MIHADGDPSIRRRFDFGGTTRSTTRWRGTAAHERTRGMLGEESETSAEDARG